MTVLWLIRHGQTDWNLEGRWQGQSADAPGLNDTGRTQGIAATGLLTNAQIKAVYSSDLLRARQTAELIAASLGLNVALEPRLREIHLGEWEGMLYDEIASRFPKELAERERDPVHSSAPGGELPAEVAKRVLAAVSDIADRHPEDSVLIVSHGIALAVIICHAQGIPLISMYEHIPENAKPYCVEWNSKR